MIRNRILTEEEGWKSWPFEDHVHPKKNGGHETHDPQND